MEWLQHDTFVSIPSNGFIMTLYLVDATVPSSSSSHPTWLFLPSLSTLLLQIRLPPSFQGTCIPVCPSLSRKIPGAAELLRSQGTSSSSAGPTPAHNRLNSCSGASGALFWLLWVTCTRMACIHTVHTD